MSTHHLFGLKSRMHRYWALGSLAVAIVAGVAAYLVFADGNTPAGPVRNATVAHGGENTLMTAANDAALRETGGLCNRAVIRARAYGVLPPTARMKAKKTETGVEGRYICKAEANAGKIYTLAVEQRCDDLADHTCLVLRTVSNPVGQVLFERRV
jgi:hypothetical protein